MARKKTDDFAIRLTNVGKKYILGTGGECAGEKVEIIGLNESGKSSLTMSTVLV